LHLLYKPITSLMQGKPTLTIDKNLS